MFISVVNLHKCKNAYFVFKTLALVIIIGVLTAAVFTSYRSSEKYINAMQSENEKSLVIIDAGHGGEDPGAVGCGGVYEKDLNLQIAFELGRALTENGFAVLYTRTEDKLLYAEHENIKGIRKISDLKNRCKIAAEYPDAIFVSVHMNSYGSSKYSGLQVYYSEQNDQSLVLASEIQKSVKESVQQQNTRVVKPGKDIYILENVQNSSVLIECGFISNDVECENLLKKEYQKQLSSAIVCGIIEYKDKISMS